MMAIPPRVPPRFVPTLTEVVQVPHAQPVNPAPVAQPRTTVMAPHAVPPAVVAPGPGAARPAAAATARAPAAPAGTAPRTGVAGGSVPSTATRSLADSALAAGRPPSSPGTGASSGATRLPGTVASAKLVDGIEEVIVHRVMQRVDVVLEKRLRDAIATVVQEQTRSVHPRLREEIESVVRHAVYEAVADELASAAASSSGR